MTLAGQRQQVVEPDRSVVGLYRHVGRRTGRPGIV